MRPHEQGQSSHDNWEWSNGTNRKRVARAHHPCIEQEGTEQDLSHVQLKIFAPRTLPCSCAHVRQTSTLLFFCCTCQSFVEAPRRPLMIIPSPRCAFRPTMMVSPNHRPCAYS